MIGIRHDPAAGRFTVQLEGATAQLVYTQRGQTMSITHAHVPPQFRGRGVAAALMESALLYARQQRLEVKAVCSYAVAYLQRQSAGTRRHQEDMLDEALEESFPASDSPAVGGVS